MLGPLQLCISLIIMLQVLLNNAVASVSPGSMYVPHSSIHKQQLEKQYPDLLPSGGIAPQNIPLSHRRERLTRNLVGFLPYWMGDCWESIPPELVTHICWFALELNATGGIDAHHGWPDGPLVDYFHTGGVPVLVTATLFNGSDLETLLSSPTYRANASGNLVERMRAGDADGVMIDFEQLPYSMYTMMTIFMNELRSLLEQAGIEDEREYQLMVCTPAVDWAGSYDYSGLSDCCDALFIMGYNYYWSGSATTGPVAPADGWGTFNVNWSVEDHLNYNGNRPEQLVLGMPWYGYDWPTASDLPGASTTASGTARTYAFARNLALEQGWQRETIAQTPWTPYLDGGWRQCWHEDTVSLGEKYDLTEAYDLQGNGIWALGYQDNWTDVWSQIEERFSEDSIPGITDLQIELTDNAILLSWTPLPDAVAYMVHASSDPHFVPTGVTLISTQANPWFEEPVSNSSRFFRVVGVFE